METYAERFHKFQTVRQPPICLSIALEDYFDPQVPADWRQAYGAYLHKRIRAAAEVLIEREDVDRLQLLEQEGWISPALVEEFLQMAMRRQKTASLVWLLGLKQDHGGFQMADFSL